MMTMMKSKIAPLDTMVQHSVCNQTTKAGEIFAGHKLYYLEDLAYEENPVLGETTHH